MFIHFYSDRTSFILKTVLDYWISLSSTLNLLNLLFSVISLRYCRLALTNWGVSLAQTFGQQDLVNFICDQTSLPPFCGCVWNCFPLVADFKWFINRPILRKHYVLSLKSHVQVSLEASSVFSATKTKFILSSSHPVFLFVCVLLYDSLCYKITEGNDGIDILENIFCRIEQKTFTSSWEISLQL